jgi:hypothetical protein
MALYSLFGLGMLEVAGPDGRSGWSQRRPVVIDVSDLGK